MGEGRRLGYLRIHVFVSDRVKGRFGESKEGEWEGHERGESSQACSEGVHVLSVLHGHYYNYVLYYCSIHVCDMLILSSVVMRLLCCVSYIAVFSGV